ncbi:MAG: DUF1592 domain-containing protein [Myxococcota bacterium]
MRPYKTTIGITFSVLFAASCAATDGGDEAAERRETLSRLQPSVELPEPTLRRLTQVQYGNAVTALLGEDVVLPTSLEPDESTDGLQAIGAGLTTISPRGVEQYERAAFDLAAQSLATEENRERLVPCTPSAVVDVECAELFVVEFGRKVWRRPLTAMETETLVSIAGDAALVFGDFHEGLVYSIAALLQSPHFLFRTELGEVDEESGERRFSSMEMASRLSFLLWNSTPDAALLDAGEAGELLTDEGLGVQVNRMIDDPRIEDGIRAFFTDMFTLYELDEMSKDPTVFTHMSPDVGPSAREETLLGVVDLVLDQDADYRDLFTTQTTFLDRKMASIYNVRAPAREGFARTELSADGGRRGFLGQASFLALNSHPVSTSATLRGKFVREVILCQYIPPPPSDINTAIPEPSADAATLRERVAVHLEDDFCASCHQLTDPIGLGFENFDGLGHWRTLENGVEIDPSGDLDSHDFTTAWEMTALVATHPAMPGCLTQTLMSYASGHSVGAGEGDAVDYHSEAFEHMDHSFLFLLKDVAMSSAFRMAGEIE